MATVDLDWQLATLENGLRLITIARPGTPTVAVRAYVRAGSRYDAHPGLAHLTEHLLFKGTRSHDQQQLFAAVERYGGILEASTAKEYVCLYAVVPTQGLVTALDVLAEILCEPALSPEAFRQEILVVQEEIRRAQDRQSALFDLFAASLWTVHPLRQPILGTETGLPGLEYESLRAFHGQRYVAGNMVLVVCGDVAHDEVNRLASHRFAGLPVGQELPPLPVQEPQPAESRCAHIERDVHQVQVLIGVPTVSMAHEDRSALKVVERLLGMGGSARLYQRLREELRLAFAVNTVTAHYEDAGFFAVHTACQPHNVSRVRDEILGQWQLLQREGISGQELGSAKGNYAGTLARRFETNLALAGIAGVEGLLHRVETPQEAVTRIGAVREDDVLRVAQRYLDVERTVEVSLGRLNGA